MAEMDVARKYSESLAGLIRTSKMHIHTLTELARENLLYADAVAAAIENHLFKVQPKEKLPCLYLMDSIMKNINSNDYRERFGRNIVQTFSQVFDTVNEQTRLLMWQLRSTWPGFFPTDTLHSLDILIQSKDPKWPLMTLTPVVIQTVPSNTPLLRQQEEAVGQQAANGRLRTVIEAQERREKERKEQLERMAKEEKEKEMEAEHRKLQEAIQAQQRQMLILQHKHLHEDLHATQLALQITQAELEKAQQERAMQLLQIQRDKKLQEKRNKKRESDEKDTEVTAKKKSRVEKSGTKNKENRFSKSKGTHDNVHTKSKPDTSDNKECSSFSIADTDKAVANKKHTDRESLEDWKKEQDMKPFPTKKTSQPGYIHNKYTWPQNYHPHSMSSVDSKAGPSRVPLLPPAPSPLKRNEPSQYLQLSHIVSPAPIRIPKALLNAIYVPESDSRFTLHAKNSARKVDIYTIILDRWHYFAKVNRLSRTFLQTNIPITVFINSSTKEVFIDKMLLFKLGESQQRVIIGGRQRMLFVHGPRKKIWIDDNLHEVLVDAPAIKVMINKHLHSILIDASIDAVVIDNVSVCRYHSDDIHRCFFGGAEHTIQLVPPLRQIQVDGQTCDLDLAGKFPSVMVNGEWRGIRFDGKPRQIIIDNLEFIVPMDRPIKVQLFSNKIYLIAFGGPGHEVIIDEEFYEVKFGGPPVQAHLGFKMFTIQLCGPPPDVKILGIMKTNYDYPDYKALSMRPLPMASLLPSTLPELLRGASQMWNSIPHHSVTSIVKAPQPIVIQQYSTTGTNCHGQLHTHTPLSCTANTPDNTPQLDVNFLFSKLVNASIIVPTSKQPLVGQSSSQTSSGWVVNFAAAQVPDLKTFNLDLMRKPFKTVLAKLKKGKQCSSCGVRLRPDHYQTHLDWHFRENRQKKDVSRRLHNRPLYPSITEWVHFEEVLDVHETLASSFFDNMLLSVHNAIKEESAIANIESAKSEPLAMENPADNVCSVCNDPLEQYFNNDLEEWHLRSAIKVGDLLYHPICYEDSNEGRARSTSNNSIEMEEATLPVLPDPITNPVKYLTALAEKARCTEAGNKTKNVAV